MNYFDVSWDQRKSTCNTDCYRSDIKRYFTSRVKLEISVAERTEMDIEDKLTEEQIEEYRDAFKFFDKDGNGYITTRELGAIMRSLGQNPTENELQDMVNEVDYDGNGVVDFGEFVNMMINQNNNTLDEKELLEAFRTFDGDDKGYIFSNEIRYVMRHMGESIPEQDINEILQDQEESRKRKITFEEFIKLVKPEV